MENAYSLYYKKINDGSTITRGYRRSLLVSPTPSEMQQQFPYNCYYTANNSNNKLIMPLDQQQELNKTSSTKYLIKLLNKSYFKKQINKFFLYFFLFYLLIYHFSYFIFDAFIILKYILLLKNNSTTTIATSNNDNIILINNFYAYTSFIYQFFCFLIYMILFWLFYKYSNTTTGYAKPKNKYCCKIDEEEEVTAISNRNNNHEIISLKSNDFSYHYSYPQQDHNESSGLSSVLKKPSFFKKYFHCFYKNFSSSSIKTTISSSSTESISSRSKNNQNKRFNFRIFIIVISIILFLINIILIKICFKSDIFKIEYSIYSSSSTSSNHPVITTRKYLFNDTDGVIDIILFILIFYLFNLIKPLFIIITSICLAIIQSIFIIIFNTTNIDDNDAFKVYIQVFIYSSARAGGSLYCPLYSLNKLFWLENKCRKCFIT